MSIKKIQASGLVPAELLLSLCLAVIIIYLCFLLTNNILPNPYFPLRKSIFLNFAMIHPISAVAAIITG